MELRILGNFPHLTDNSFEELVASGSGITTWVLTDFNDPNVGLMKVTHDVDDLILVLNQLYGTFGGGDNDIEEQAFRGDWETWNKNLEYVNLSPGIEITLDNMPDNGVLLVITDAGTKQRELAETIQRKASLSLSSLTFTY